MINCIKNIFKKKPRFPEKTTQNNDTIPDSVSEKTKRIIIQDLTKINLELYLENQKLKENQSKYYDEYNLLIYKYTEEISGMYQLIAKERESIRTKKQAAETIISALKKIAS